MSDCKNGLFNCITPLPMDASGKMSDYEFLCWVTSNMNKICSYLNTLPEYVNKQIEEYLKDLNLNAMFKFKPASMNMSLQTVFNRAYDGSILCSNTDHSNTLYQVTNEANGTLYIYNMSTDIFELISTISINMMPTSLCVDNNKNIYLLLNNVIYKYNSSMVLQESYDIPCVCIRYDSNKNQFLVLTNGSGTVVTYDENFNYINSVNYNNLNEQTSFDFNDDLIVFLRASNRTVRVHYRNYPEQGFQAIYNIPKWSNGQNAITQTFDVSFYNYSTPGTFYFYSNTFVVGYNNSNNLSTISQYDAYHNWDGGQFDNSMLFTNVITQYIVKNSKNTIQKISGARNWPYYDLNHAVTEASSSPAQGITFVMADSVDSEYDETFLNTISDKVIINKDLSNVTITFNGFNIINCLNVNINNIHFKSKISGTQATICLVQSSIVIFNGCTFDNYGTSYHVQAYGSIIAFNNCTFLNNGSPTAKNVKLFYSQDISD